MLPPSFARSFLLCLVARIPSRCRPRTRSSCGACTELANSKRPRLSSSSSCSPPSIKAPALRLRQTDGARCRQCAHDTHARTHTSVASARARARSLKALKAPPSGRPGCWPGASNVSSPVQSSLLCSTRLDYTRLDSTRPISSAALSVDTLCLPPNPVGARALSAL